MVIEVGYTGAWGRNLDRAHLVNNATPSPLPLGPRRPCQTISFVPARASGCVADSEHDVPGGPHQPASSSPRTPTTTPAMSRPAAARARLSFLANYTYAKACPTHHRSDRLAWNPRSRRTKCNLANEWGRELRHPSPVRRQLDHQAPAHRRRRRAQPAGTDWKVDRG
jgi:hypothetical protein